MWEGTAHFTNVGSNQHWREFISRITPRQRELFRMPPVGHDYYTSHALVELEKIYPGFDDSGEYAAAVAARGVVENGDVPLAWSADSERLVARL